MHKNVFQRSNRIALQIENFTHMEFSFLYNKKRNLFTVGFTVDRRRKDSGHYDLLASEARLTSFIAIAQEEIPKENWFSPWPAHRQVRYRDPALLMERFDVRVPHAPDCDAFLQGNPSRTDLRSRGTETNRV